MQNISIFNTTISNYNLGNQIIMEAVYKHLREIFPNDFFFDLPSIEITRHTKQYLRQSDKIFFGGTNSLNGNMERYKQWGINIFNASYVQETILMGMGWWQYQKSISLYTRRLLKKVLSKNFIHSVRDHYTYQKLQEIGIKNVLNTGCPALWDLDKAHCTAIPRDKASSVVMTITDYNKNIERDKTLFELLKKNYSNVYLWLQGSGDYKYVSTHFAPSVHIIPPSCADFESMLDNTDIDYVGTRLHAGIKALQRKKRTLIIGIDNRAKEMKKDFGLPVIEEKNMDALEERICSSFCTEIALPADQITQWKNQFKNEYTPS